MHYKVSEIASIIGASVDLADDIEINDVSIDSRVRSDFSHVVFFPVKGESWDGHAFIDDVIHKGGKCIVAERDKVLRIVPEVNYLWVDDVMSSMQEFAKIHRDRSSIEVVGVTGSYGKTIVKEWIAALMDYSDDLIRSPKSYNSQIGVPLSLFGIRNHHKIGVFEAGISQQGEMNLLERMIKPSIGVFTGLGEAHSSGFPNDTEKLKEKLQLFRNAQTIILADKHKDAKELLKAHSLFLWGTSSDCDLKVLSSHRKAKTTQLTIEYEDSISVFDIPFLQEELIDDALTAIATCLVLDVPIELIKLKVGGLELVDQRLEITKGVNNSIIVSDLCNSDLFTIGIAMDYANIHHKIGEKYIILSELANPIPGLTDKLLRLLKEKGYSHLIGVGKHFVDEQSAYHSALESFKAFDTEEQLLASINLFEYAGATILLKGGSNFDFKRIKDRFEEKVHDTILEVNLSQIRRNLGAYRKQLDSNTKIMAMIKADSYGSGSNEMARYLESINVQYFGVAYMDEGIQLRLAGIQSPIMVMNANLPYSLSQIERYSLEPQIHTLDQLKTIDEAVKKGNLQNLGIHLKLNTGMNRLGFDLEEIAEVTKIIESNEAINIRSIYSHLAASDDLDQSTYTNQQINLFNEMLDLIPNSLKDGTMLHLLNSFGVQNYPSAKYDCVRLGIGLYGVEGNLNEIDSAVTLKARVAQVRDLKEGSSLGYTGNNILLRDTVVAVVKIGYADGFDRRLGNGSHKMYIDGIECPTIGNVCMDLTFIDVTHIPEVAENEEVVVMRGQDIPNIAKQLNTISYEILSKFSSRVKRKYFLE